MSAYNFENPSIEDFISLTATGLHTARFDQIQEALINRYKEIYGSDIDVSNVSADGIFIMNLSMIINNILRACDEIYENLDVNYASGEHLDALCRLSNITRKPATRSKAKILVSTEEIGQQIKNDARFVDKSGVEWVYNGQTLTLTENVPVEINVFCTEYGPFKCPAGWINQTLEDSYISVEQDEEGEVGENIESDRDLKARRNQSTGPKGTTVIESLIGSLLDAGGVNDVKIYNNNSSSSFSADDATSVAAHSVYIILKKTYQSSVLDSSKIGNLIYSKLTPGIGTSAASSAIGGKSYTFNPTTSAGTIIPINQTVNWKEAIPVTTPIGITIKALDHFDNGELSGGSYTGGTIELIGQAIKDFMNSQKLGVNPDTLNMMIEAVYADPKFKGLPTYLVTDVDYSADENKDSYFYYTDLNTVSATKSGSVYTITIS